MGQSLVTSPWREMPANNRENLSSVKQYEPKNTDVQHLRVLLHGPVGAGKSSFINSVDTVLRRKITGRALADGNLVEGSFTTKFNPSSPLKEGDEGYNPSPTLQDRVHVLVSVVPADGAVIITDEMVKKMRKIRKAASGMGIPQLAIITKGDKACPAVKDNVENLYKSKYLKKKADEFCAKLGISMNCVFLVKNYDKETSPKDDVDAPILCALTQIISFGDDFLNDVKRKEKI
ncbi:interferon-induced protein 44-like isoform X2 [Takifugu rubripes]|uniref:interferon-induced protein 44-like isoform X2 n=1 Tax=Takifugu rubripes TaxID=31033 RepID=UPI0011456934|nr:interferon-induced protein 44-like isoform X2 [Takifugu rubripes]